MRHEREPFKVGTQVIIMNYEQASKNVWEMQKHNFKVCIIDEAQNLKSKEYYMKDGKNIVRIGSEMKRAILLTGSKLLKRPRHLYYLMRIVRPDLIPGFYEFGYRYCDPR